MLQNALSHGRHSLILPVGISKRTIRMHEVKEDTVVHQVILPRLEVGRGGVIDTVDPAGLGHFLLRPSQTYEP